MKLPVLIALCLLCSLCACNSDDAPGAAADKASYVATKQQLKEKEMKRPADFLHIAGSDRHNLLGQTVVKGSITSKATVAVFKDADIQLDFYSKTGALLETDKETIYETFNPGESKNFKTKYFAPKGTDSVALKVLGAKVIP